MSAPETPPGSPSFDELLASCHEALLADRPLPAGAAVPPDLAARLQQDLECLRRLERARRRLARGGLGFAPSSGTVGQTDCFELRPGPGGEADQAGGK